MDKALLECVVCKKRFSVSEVASGVYCLETMVCYFCYAAMQAKPHSSCCFGKPTTILENGKKILGYDARAEECKNLCPDRIPCRRIIIRSSAA